MTIKRETSGGGRKMPIMVGKEPEAVSWLGGWRVVELKSLV